MSEPLDGQIAAWRGYLERHSSLRGDDIAEMEDHLREQISDLVAVGLSDGEAFLVAISRLGSLDAVSREFAREHSDRLWKQLTLAPAEEVPGSRRELPVVLALGVGAAAAVKIGVETMSTLTFAVTGGLLVTPFLAGYFAWKRRLRPTVSAVLAGLFAAMAVAMAAYPWRDEADTAVLAALHGPVVLWLLVGLAYSGGQWRSGRERMNFVRFTGEILVYYALLALGGGVLVALTLGSFAAVGIDPTGFLGHWVLPVAMPGAVLVAAWLVEAKQSVIENIAPVLTRVFTPLTIIMLVALIAAYLTKGTVADTDRTLLILMDLILILVLGLVLYTLSARDPAAPASLLDWLQMVLLLAALVVDVLMLVATLGRLAEFGTSPNKAAALGLNVLLLVNLGWSAWLSLAFLRGRRPVAALERWQTGYLPVIGCWAAVVAVALPPMWGFA